jgi:hypothetical protein
MTRSPKIGPTSGPSERCEEPRDGWLDLVGVLEERSSVSGGSQGVRAATLGANYVVDGGLVKAM